MSTPKRKFPGLGTGPKVAWRPLLVLAASLGAVGVGLIVHANLSRQSPEGDDAAPPGAATAPAPASGAAGMVVAIDPETGALTQPTAAQMQELQQPPQKPPEVTTYSLADGPVIANLDESFDHYSVVEIGADGKLQHLCQTARECSLLTGQALPHATAGEK